ncbi:S-layer protein [Phormidium sp. CCY1219]|uniref:S-layer protein n=1 Tax=Phormidium sp. CCY1219 TaxID=2886104 RepID=UPI002D1E5ECE|nr:S-layer protein [Phormidium sp. CCY1219]MEB3827220.1 S-layer protein [Phormidium sp. CCY1219]
MRVIFAIATSLMAIAGWAMPVRSQDSAPVSESAPRAQAPVTREQIVRACVQDRVEVLPPLYTDVPRNHWAYSSVQKIGYCGPFRSATPPELIERLIREGDLLPQQ